MFSNLDELKNLIQLLKEEGVTEFSYEKDDFSVDLSFESKTPVIQQAAPQVLQAATPVPQALPVSKSDNAATSEDDKLKHITAPIIGTFYRSPGPGMDPFVSIGDEIKPGQVLCIIEAMKLMNEIESEEHGIIESIEINDGNPVEYGTLLFKISPLN